jgi:hypothetical protein
VHHKFGFLFAIRRENQKNMKNPVFKIAFALLFLSSLTSCMKEVTPAPAVAANAVTAKTTFEVKASKDFKWNTTNSLNVSFKGIHNDVRVAILKVVTPDGGILFKKLQKANEDYSIQLTLPAQYDKVSLQFDGENRTFDTKLGKVEMILN